MGARRLTVCLYPQQINNHHRRKLVASLKCELYSSFFFSFFPFSWSELQLYARPLGTLFLLGSLALWTLFFLTIRARRRRAEIFYRRKCHSFPYQFTDFFFFWFLQSRTKFSLSFPDKRATYVVEVLRPHLRHPIIIIQTLRSD